MPTSNLFPVVGGLLVATLCLSMFLPIGLTYHETCTECQGKGTVTCTTCRGSGKCWVCEGTGKIWYMPEDGWCAACRGSGRCYTCEGLCWLTCIECAGTGLFWMYSSVGSAIALSIVNIFSFLGIFALSYIMSAFYLSYNEWVYAVEDMGYWFNPSYMTWLFAKHRRRWVKWQTVLNPIFGVYLGTLFFFFLSYKRATQASFFLGFLLNMPIVALFSLIFYKSYVSTLEQ